MKNYVTSPTNAVPMPHPGMTTRRERAAAYRVCIQRGLTPSETARELGVTVETVYRDYIQRGLTPSETARELGVTVEAVYLWAKRHNAIFWKPRKVSERERGDAYRDCVQRGLTKTQTARELGVSRQAVHIWAKLHNVTFTKR